MPCLLYHAKGKGAMPFLGKKPANHPLTPGAVLPGWPEAGASASCLGARPSLATNRHTRGPLSTAVDISECVGRMTLHAHLFLYLRDDSEVVLCS